MIAPDAPIARFAAIDSTSLEARRRAEAGDCGPAWLVAERQTAGRGRRGRSWASPAGNLYATYLGAAAIAPARLALLGLAAAVAVAETVEALGGALPPRLKWPNDVLLDGAKVAGLLLESGAAPGEGAGLWFALGIGINVASAPTDLPYPAACLADAGVTAAPEAVFAALRPRLAGWARRLADDGFAPVRDAWLARGPAPGAALSVSLGEERIAGAFETLAESGGLVARLADGSLRTFAAGEVAHPAAPGPA